MDDHRKTPPSFPSFRPQLPISPRRRRAWAGRLQWAAADRSVAPLADDRRGDYAPPTSPAGACPDRGACPSCGAQLGWDLDRAILAIPAAHRPAYLLAAALRVLPPASLQLFALLLGGGRR